MDLKGSMDFFSVLKKPKLESNAPALDIRNTLSKRSFVCTNRFIIFFIHFIIDYKNLGF